MNKSMRAVYEAIERVTQKMNRHSIEATTTLMMIAAHESMGGKYRKQIGGKALSVFQIEPETHDSIWDNCDSIKKLARKCGFVRDASQLATNDDYAVFVARCYLLMDGNPLPSGVHETSKYCKSYWNRTGKASDHKYLQDYITYVIRS